ncbi:outer membrane assembly protein AsmA [Jinshanibacter sp. LJY008]|uniref:Outer membrane assembly protein AsmA n=1 Tax=Limnobaculum eriocheiris TaxID=2897391 RepID=A0A9X1MS35_9GAMM|nr:outer membrane assembly protein AsmA [Limnobaculum eriocheiris]MCD1124601.1 outer membrane assembly protein AsmA [Limnobaculum eriocheiris]
MRRFLTTLAIILVVIVAGMTALILLINPNDFRDYMVKNVEDKTGYQLKIEGDLRWHVWPQLSILAGQMSLTAPGAPKPIIGAENMRLDVELFPLLSHQLIVKNVVLKGGVIQLIPETQSQKPQNAPIAPAGTQAPKSPAESTASAWSLELNKVKIADSLLVWQRSENDIINVRDINLTLTRTDARKADVSAKARINRDQRELSFSLDGGLNLNHFPQGLELAVNSLDYQLQGADIPVEGIQGSGNFNLAYLSSPPGIKISPLALTFNGNHVTADISASLDDTPVYTLAVKADTLNLDQLFPPSVANGSSEEGAATGAKEASAPVTSSVNGLTIQPDLTFLQSFNAQLELEVNNLVYHGVPVSAVVMKGSNQQGKAVINNLQASIAGGSVNVSGTVDATSTMPKITVKPIVHDVALEDLLKTLNYPQTLTGSVTAQGTFNNVGSNISDLEKGWQGYAHINIDQVRLHGLNIQQLIQQAASRSNSDVKGMEHYERYTEVKNLVVDTVFNQGQLKVTRMNGASEFLTVDGTGVLNLPAKSCDMRLNINVTQGWQGKSEIVSLLQKSVIPLRIYGPWSKLNYQLNVEQILRDQLKGEVGKAIDKWMDKNKDKQESKDIQKVLEKLKP